jgi:hypothetical protein
MLICSGASLQIRAQQQHIARSIRDHTHSSNKNRLITFIDTHCVYSIDKADQAILLSPIMIYLFVLLSELPHEAPFLKFAERCSRRDSALYMLLYTLSSWETGRHDPQSPTFKPFVWSNWSCCSELRASVQYTDTITTS